METRLQRLLHGLRWCGAAMVVAAAGTFLVQSWNEVGDVVRYTCLLGMTAALPLLAYVCGVRLAEGRSARVALITLLALIPVHAGVLGGFVLSQFGLNETTVRGAAQWVAPSMTAAVLLVVGSAAVLLPLVWSAYRVLCRKHANLLTATSALSHGLLLIPERSALGATVATIPMLAAAAWTVWRIRPTTKEARIAVGSLLGPVLLLISRQVLFYEVTAAFWGAILGATAVAMFAVGEQVEDKIVTRFAIVPTLASVGAFWLPWVEQLSRTARVDVGDGFLLYGILASVPLLGFALRSPGSRNFFVATAATVNAVLAGLIIWFEPGPWVALEALFLGLVFLSYGFLRKRRLCVCAGVALAGPGFVVEVAHAIGSFSASGWLALAGFGLGLVGITAFIEQRSRRAALEEGDEPACQTVQ